MTWQNILKKEMIDYDELHHSIEEKLDNIFNGNIFGEKDYTEKKVEELNKRYGKEFGEFEISFSIWNNPSFRTYSYRYSPIALYCEISYRGKPYKEASFDLKGKLSVQDKMSDGQIREEDQKDLVALEEEMDNDSVHHGEDYGY